MSELPKGPLPQGPKPGPRYTSFFPDPMIDHLLRAVVSLTMELSVTRERLQSLEHSLENDSKLNSEALNSLTLPPEIEQARAKERRQLIEDILGPMVSRLANQPSGKTD